jgi:hypothetical protein
VLLFAWPLTNCCCCCAAGFVLRYFGRPAAYHITGWLNIIGAIVQITAHNHHILLLGRAICGLGEGFGE